MVQISQLQKFLRVYMKDGKESVITQESYESPAFRRIYETKIKKVKAISFEDPFYLSITGLTKEQVDQLKPSFNKPKVETETKFTFPSIDKLEAETNITKTDKPATVRKSKSRKTAVKSLASSTKNTQI